MEEERRKEETTAEEQDLVTSRPISLPREPYIWLMITDGENDSERHIFYSITEDRYHVRFVPELHNKYVACCYGGLLVLRDKSTNDCSILNILTMERLQLPPLNIDLCSECIISSPKMDESCRVIFFERALRKFWSCHLGDSEFIEQESTYIDGYMISNIINFKGKLYTLTCHDWNLIASDFSDTGLCHEQVVNGRSLSNFIFTGVEKTIYLVESCEDLLLIYMGSYDCQVSDVKVFKADFSIREWVKLDTLGDRAIFLGSTNKSTFSSAATAVGMKGNAVYWVNATNWVRIAFPWLPPERTLCMYDIEDRSISMSCPFPTVRTYSSLYWVSFPMTCDEEKKFEQEDRNFLFKASPIQTSFHVHRGKATIEKTELQIEQRKTKKREETETIGSTIVNKESLWADLHNDLLLEIFSFLCAGDSVAFRSVCRSWYSVSTPLFRTTQQFLLPLKNSGCSFPLLMCPNKKLYNQIHGELYSMNFPDMSGAKVRAARDGWVLLDYYSSQLYFYNPSTKIEIQLPECDAVFYYSVYFSSAPAPDFLVVVAAQRWDGSCAICIMNVEDNGWIYHEVLSPETESETESSDFTFDFSYCNAVVFEGMYYFLGVDAKLLVFNPKNDDVSVSEAPKFISELKVEYGQQYMLESDGKLIAVFVGTEGSSVYTCEWNVSTGKWDVLESLGNVMLFVSRPLSICIKATVRGTGNKIYFPRVVGEGDILFYSLATRRYHTFEMGTSYSNFFASMFYPELNGWFMP